MILGFKTEINGQETKFPEKIWQSFSEVFREKHFPSYIGGFFDVDYDFDKNAIEFMPKPHTIREDKKDRWKAGNDIHFGINVRTKNYYQFAPVLKCISTQKIEIYKMNTGIGDVWVVKVDDKFLQWVEIKLLSINDGFTSTKDFFDYFGDGFKGKIIHWTKLKY